MPPTISCSRCATELDPTAAFCSTCGLARTGVPTTGGRRAVLGDPVLDLLRQITVGEYDIGGRLGVGGMASVYLAHELRLNRRVAIKAMLPDLLQKEDMVERFFDEARKQARLEHRNIVPIYSLQWNAELPFFVMKFVDGFSTDDIIRARGSLPVPIVQHILSATIAALQYAHDEGVIHRDVKPGNILIDRRGEAVVSDFGIAKAAESPHLTQTGAAIGTPAYMSPEQCRGLPVTPASDQYSVGVLAYQLLTGSTPFSGSMLDLLVAHTESPPPPIVDRCPGCPPRLLSAIMRMLEKAEEDRWPELRDALPDVLDGMGDEAGVRRQLVEWFPDRPTSAEALPLTPLSPLPATSRPQKKTAPPITLVATPANGVWEIEVGDTVRIQARRSGDAEVTQPRPDTLSWASQDTSIATVTADGLVSAHAPGPVTIVAIEEGLTARCDLTVVSATVASVRIQPTEGSMVVGETIAFAAEALDARGQPLADRTFDWRCNDSSKATASEDGVVSAVAAGDVEITAVSEGHECTVRLTIVPVPVVATAPVSLPHEEMPAVEPPAPAAVEVLAAEKPVVPREPIPAPPVPPRGHGLRVAIGAGLVVVIAAIVFMMTRKGDTVVAPAPVAVVADSARAQVDTTTQPIAPGEAVARVTLILTRVAMNVGDSVHALVRAFDARGERISGARIVLSATAPNILSVDSLGLVIATAPGTSMVIAQSGTAKASEAVSVAPRRKALSQSEATNAINPILASVSGEQWADVQEILDPDVLDAMKKSNINASLSGEPKIVSSTTQAATVDFDVAMTFTNRLRRGRNAEAPLRAKLTRSDKGWRVTQVSARGKLP